MKASHIINISANTALSTLNVKTMDDVMIELVNMAVSEIYRRFNMGITTEVILVRGNKDLYEISDTEADFLLGLYDSNGMQLKESSFKNDPTTDYKRISYKSFILLNKSTDYIVAFYRKNPKRVEDLEDTVELPSTMMNLVLLYVAYAGLGMISTPEKGQQESLSYMERFDVACNEFISQGYRIELSTEIDPIQWRGYV